MPMLIRLKIGVCLLCFLWLGLTQALWAMDKHTAQLIDEEIKKHIQEIVQTRRYLHMNPELSNREFATSKLVASKLLSMGLEVKTGLAKTGVVGLLRGNNAAFTIGYRADMDALPIQEDTNVSYASLNPGVMHACGHDIHTSIGLGAALVLSQLKDHLKGNIKFIFQPAEEGAPSGEEGGADLMVRQGVLEDPPVSAIFGLHVWPDADVGEVLFSPGPVLASSDSFDIILTAKSSHGARPYEGTDTIVLASQVILTIHSTLSRIIDPADPAVVSIGKIQGGIRSNIIAEKVHLTGTVRTHSDVNRFRIERLLEDITRGITHPVGADYQLLYERGAPPVFNHPDLADIMLPTLKQVLGQDKVKPINPQMVAEDFSEFSQTIPGFYFFLGVRSPGAESMPPLHNPKFNPDERSLAVGIRTVCHLLLDCLAHQSHFADESD